MALFVSGGDNSTLTRNMFNALRDPNALLQQTLGRVSPPCGRTGFTLQKSGGQAFF